MRFGCLCRCAAAAIAVAALGALVPATVAASARSTSPSHQQRSCYARVALSHGALRFSGLDGRSLDIRTYREPLMLAQAPACASKVEVGHSYTATLRYRSTTSAVALEVLTHSRRGWKVWYVAQPKLEATRAIASVTVLLRAIQGGVDHVALALALHGRGSVQVDGSSLVDASLHPQAVSTGNPVAVSTSSPSPSVPAGSVVEAPLTEQPLEASGPSKTGRWTVLEGIDHARSVHAVLLQNGKLLIMAGSGNSRMEFERGSFKSYTYNPIANTWKELETPKDVFCSGHVQLANGNVLILGGTSGYPPAPKPGEYPSTVYRGENMSWIFNIRSEKYEEVPYDKLEPSNKTEPGPLLSGTWYPDATELGNGDVISFGGLDEQGEGTTDTNYYTGPGNQASDGDLPEEWVGWGSSKLQQTYDWFWGLYPSMILTADGRLFYDGSHVFGNGLEGDPQALEGSSLYDFYCTPGKSQAEEEKEQNETNPNAQVQGPNGTFKRVQDTPGLTEPDFRDQSASLLLPPAQEQKVLIIGGGNTYETTHDAINTTDEINLKEVEPHWVSGPDLPRGTMEDGSMEPEGAGKMYVSAVALPDGTVLETGGSLLPRTDNVHEASIFNPTSDSFTSVATDPVGRNYHSEALLLPDGRVIALGSNPADPATGEESFETRVSIYEPPYLFKGERPVLNLIDGEANHLEGNITATKQWEYGSEHTLSYSSPSSAITSAVLIRPAAVTHSSDPNQREVALPITNDEHGTLTVSLTPNPNLAPPGYYMVFLVNANGVPSVAKWVHVGPQGAP
jgi:Domain of unknown function (DUF1929)